MSDPRLGTELAGYRVVRLIGRGGMSVVYLAEHIGLGRKVALKVLGPELADDELVPGTVHPRVPDRRPSRPPEHRHGLRRGRGRRRPVHLDAVRRGHRSRTAVAGRDATGAGSCRLPDLAGCCGTGRRSRRRAGPPRREAREHPARIRPALVVRPRLPLGLRRHEAVGHGAGITRTGQFVGSVDYVSPEQIRGEAVDGRADVYSWGACCTGA